MNGNPGYSHDGCATKEEQPSCKQTGKPLRKPVIICGDFNVAATPMDIKNPKSNVKNAGFTPEERGKFAELLDSGFTDTFRYMHPDADRPLWHLLSLIKTQAPRP